MLQIIRFFREAYIEVKTKMSWPTYQELQNLVFWFFILLMTWTVFLFGVNELGRLLQEIVYEWIKTNTKNN